MRTKTRPPSASAVEELGKEAEAQIAEGWQTIAAPNPLNSGSFELDHIRRNARYILNAGTFSAVASLLFSFFMHIVGIATTIIVPAAILGYLQSAIFGTPEAAFAIPLIIATGIFYLFVFGLWMQSYLRRWELRKRGLLKSESDIRRDEIVWSTLVVSALLAVCQLLRAYLPDNLFAPPTVAQDSRRLAVSFVGAYGVLAALAPLLAAITKVPVAIRPAGAGRIIDRFTKLILALILRIAQLITAFIVPIVVVSVFFAGWSLGYNSGQTFLSTIARDPWLIFAYVFPFLIVLEFLTFSYLGLSTPFSQYREAVSGCFAIIRQIRHSDEIRVLKRAEYPLLSRLRSLTDMPELVILASANLSEIGNAPAGSFARPIVFTPYTVSIPGVNGAVLDTIALEKALGSRWVGGPFRCSLMDCVAITGAAISPTMGRFSRWWLRALLFLLNFRLGVWIPNPASEKVRESLRTPPSRKARHMFRPRTLRYALREAIGRHCLNADQIYVSDGGHYDNLGLVELVRRGCTEIWAIDASLDPPGSPVTLAQTLTLLRAELGCDVDVDLEPLQLDQTDSKASAYPLLRSTSVHGTVTRRSDGQPQQLCKIHVVKLGLDRQTSARLVTLRRRYPKFPYDSTLNQFYNAERFDLYHELGYESTLRAIRDTAVHTSDRENGTVKGIKSRAKDMLKAWVD